MKKELEEKQKMYQSLKGFVLKISLVIVNQYAIPSSHITARGIGDALPIICILVFIVLVSRLK